MPSTGDLPNPGTEPSSLISSSLAGRFLTTRKPLTKHNSKSIKGFDAKPKIIQFLEENRGSELLDIGLRNDFLDLTPKTKATKAKINKWDCLHSTSNFQTLSLM